VRKHTIIFALSFVLLIAFGLVYNHLIVAEQARLKEQKYYDLFTKIEVEKLVENNEVEFLVEEDTSIIRRLDAFKDDKLVGIVYVGESEGRNGTIQVAFAVDAKKHAIVGMLIVESNETPEYQGKLTSNDKFVDQFANKDMSAKKFTVEATSGATITGDAINRIMQLVRAQYDNDTDFETPAGIEFVSSRQDFTTLNFIYEFVAEEETITVTTNQNYEIVELSNEAFREDVIIEIEANPMKAYIKSIEGDTLTIISKGFSGTLESTATVVDGEITSFVTDLSKETYDSPYNDPYKGGDFNDMFEDIVNGNELEAITGATVTSEGVIEAHKILLAYLEGVNANE